jgi:hypothetical protein
MLCNKKLPSVHQEPSRRYGRKNLRLCNTCSTTTTKPDITTLDICRFLVAKAGFSPSSHSELSHRDTLITTSLQTIFNQCRIPTADLLTHIAIFMQLSPLPANIQRDIAPYHQVTQFDPENPHPSLSKPCSANHVEWNTWLPSLDEKIKKTRNHHHKYKYNRIKVRHKTHIKHLQHQKHQ